MPTFLYALCWFVPLSGIAYVLSVFEIFPKQYHWIVGLVYLAAIGIAIWRIIACAIRHTWSDAQKAKVQELRDRKAAKIAAQQASQFDERYEETNQHYH